jgi:small subunit ribosomal protein S2
VLDSNSNPDGVTYPVPGNDDALRAIGMYCDLIADAVLDGIQAEMTASGTDIGESAEGPLETLPEQAEPAAAAETPAEQPAEAEATPQA